MHVLVPVADEEVPVPPDETVVEELDELVEDVVVVWKQRLAD